MGYRAVWARMTATEKRLGQKLLIRKSGGAAGGGSQLTPLAETMLLQYENVQKDIEKTTDTKFLDALGEHINIINDPGSDNCHACNPKIDGQNKKP